MKKLKNKNFLVVMVCLLLSSNQVTGAYAMNVDDQGQNSENVGTNQQDQTVIENQQDQSGQTKEETQQDQSGQSREKTQQNQSSQVIVESGKSQNVQHHGLCLSSRAKANMLPPRTMSMALSNFKRSSGVGKVEISQNTNKKPQTNDGSKQCECCGKIKFKNKGGALPSLLIKNPHEIPGSIFLRTNLEMEGSGQDKPIFSCDGKIEVCGGSVTLKNLDIHGHFRVTDNSSLTLENCVLTHSSNANPDAIAIECANGKVDMKNCVVKDCLVTSVPAGLMTSGSGGLSYVRKSTINCDHCSFDQKMPQQKLSPEDYKAERRRHQCSLLALKGGIICCSGCDFNSNVPQNTDVYANEKGVIELESCNLNLNGSISMCFSINGFIKIKNSSFGCGSFNKNSDVEIDSCKGDNIFSQSSKVKILNTQMQNTQSDKSCFNFKNSEVECENVISQNLVVDQPIFFVTSSKVRGKNMTFVPSRFVIFAKDGSDISLTNHNISPFSSSIAINSKISHTGVLNCKIVGSGMETVLGNDQVIMKLDFKNPNIDVDNLNYSSNGIDTAKNDFVLKRIENCSGRKFFDFDQNLEHELKLCTKQPSMSKVHCIEFFENSMQLPCKKFVVDKFGKCFTSSIYLDDMNPLLLKHKSIFGRRSDKEGRFACLSDAVGSRCPICLDENGLDVVLLPCRHVCHAECLNKNVTTCPVCRQTIVAKLFAH